jgi:hypothetical protein
MMSERIKIYDLRMTIYEFNIRNVAKIGGMCHAIAAAPGRWQILLPAGKILFNHETHEPHERNTKAGQTG